MRLARALCLAFAVLASSLAVASNDTVYLPDQGKVVIPNLKVGSQYYYVILNQLPNSYDFRLNSPSITALAFPLTFTPASASDLIGTFSHADEASAQVTFKLDGTYSIIKGASDVFCKLGPEAGTYQYDATNGILIAVATSKGDCGMSYNDGIARVKKSSGDLFFVFTKSGQAQEIKLIRK